MAGIDVLLNPILASVQIDVSALSADRDGNLFERLLEMLMAGGGGDVYGLYEDYGVSSVIVTTGSAGAYGSWVEVDSDVGTGKHLFGIAAVVAVNVDATVEFGEGSVASESPITRVTVHDSAAAQSQWVPINKPLTDNARLAARTKGGTGQSFAFIPLIGTRG